MVGGLLDGAVDPEGLPLFARLVTPPTHALLVVGPDTGGVFVPGSYFFLPAGEAGFQGPSDFFGSDFLEFVAVDDGGLESPLVRLDVVVLPVNDAPTGESMTFSALEDFPLHVDPPGVLSTSFDADGDPLEVHLVSGPSWSSTPGTFTLGLDGYLDFLSPPNESGTYAFTFKLFDGTVDSELITSTIVVEPTPDLPIVNPDTYATDEDVPLFVSAADGLSSNDSDPDGDTLTCNIRTDPGNGVAFVALDCSLSYESTPDWNGIDSFLVDVSDGLSVVTSQVTISVRPVNDNPIALDDFYLMVSGDVLHANVLDNDADHAHVNGFVHAQVHD
ncbi:MAG: tandem-95 repeat protein [Deltaproteobacteria bacterium]|nr:tandem-95 repeat protein [Deltaproteobacteria bacterium]